MEQKLESYRQTRQLLLESINIKEPSKIQELLIIVMAINNFHSLQCLNQKDQKCEFPLKWNQSHQGVYRLKYLIPKSQYQGKVLQFRLVDNGDGISVNFVVENTEMLYSVELSTSKDYQQNLEIYENQILKVLSPNSSKSRGEGYENEQQRPRNMPYLLPVPMPLQSGGNDRPLPFDVGPGTIPIGAPFNRQEYVGPNSGIFGGVQGHQGPRMPTGNQRPPPGARWDPLDPFGGENQPGRGQFSGFNQWGQPNNSNPFSGQFGPNGSRFF